MSVKIAEQIISLTLSKKKYFISIPMPVQLTNINCWSSIIIKIISINSFMIAY